MSTEPRVISYELRRVDLLRMRADVVALKYARTFLGADLAVAEAFREKGLSTTQFELAEAAHKLAPSEGVISASSVLFVGVPEIGEFLYEQIRRFSTHVLTILAREAPDVRTVAMTMHGAGYGLDILEAARQQLLGVKDALSTGSYPEALEAVVIAEVKPDRLQSAAVAIEEEQGTVIPPQDWEPRGRQEWPIFPVRPPVIPRAKTQRAIRAAVQKAARKPKKRATVFVAMPFAKKMRVVWEYGIRGPVRRADLICERMDKKVFTGGIMEKVLESIQSAGLVIADLTGDNPNVFLEVGYSWGRTRPTLFLCQKQQTDNPELPFDVSGHVCLFYEDAFDLDKQLTEYLKDLDLGS